MNKKSKKKDKKDKVEIKMGKVLDISHAKSLYELLTQYAGDLGSVSSVKLNFEDTSLITTPCMQIIYSFLDLATDNEVSVDIVKVGKKLEDDIKLLGFGDNFLNEYS